LLGDGFFARGFIHTIDRRKFHITQIYREKFINPQDLTFSSDFHLRDFIYARPDKELTVNIRELNLNISPGTVKINDENYRFDHLVIGLGAQKSIAEWREQANNILSDKHTDDINIVGMGPTGIELAFMFKTEKTQPNLKVSLHDALSEEKILSYLSANGKRTVLSSLSKYGIDANYNTFYNGSTGTIIKCIGTQPNSLTKNFTVNDELQVNGYTNVYMGGDCSTAASGNYVKSAQVAYQQGVYVARKLNDAGAPAEPFTYKHGGSALSLGDKKVLIDGHKYIPNGVYPSFLIRMYSFFCV
jgi:NADH dehydrogenase FAD-containing subunit